MKKKTYTLALAALIVAGAKAAPLNVCDFESYEIGTEWTMWQMEGNSITSTARVVADPKNANNKVLHITLKDWGCHPEFTLPTDLRGQALTERYPMVRYKLYRNSNDNDNWKQFAAFIGSEELYRDEGYPEQGSKQVWQTKTYTLKQASASNTSNKLHLGIHHNNSDFYIDDIELVGAWDDYLTPEDGSTLDYCVSNSSDSYKTISDHIYIPAGQTVNVRTSRYSEWTSKVAGEGTLNIYAGGERSYIGTKASKGSTYPDWSGMKGEVHVYPYKAVISNCGFYGLLLSSGTFQPDNIEASNYNRLFEGKKVVLHNGATIAIEANTRGVRIGELHTEAGSTLSGYYKSSSANSYFVLGGSNTNATLAGKIHATNGNKVGLIKEGTGNLTITGNDNDINAGIRLLEGTLTIDNDAQAAQTGKKSGATGSSGTLTVFGKGTLAGNGSIAAPTEVYGTIAPTGTLHFANYKATTSALKVTLHPEANIVCTVKSATEYAQLDISGTLARNGKTEEFEDSEEMPSLTIALAEDATLAMGDELTLLTATQKSGTDWNLHIRYPQAYTWAVEQRQEEDGSFSAVARVTSLAYGNQGEGNEEGGQEEENKGYPDDDWTFDLTDKTPLRTYAEQLGKYIGVAGASYRYDCSRNDGETGLVGNQFNMIVGENEMKFDATEPEQNSFSYGGSDAIVWVADRFDQVVRGHTLAWHSQVPGWVSQDGKKNNHNFTRQQLLNILKNHIFNVVGKYKGRIREWDVCNEVLDDDQSIVRTDPTAYKLRPSIWSTYIGEEFIDSAFVWAHQADPQAKLYINDYGVEFAGSTKTEAYYNLVKRLKDDGLPIDGCGLQCHLTTGELDTLKLEKNIQRYATLGLDCIITELDIALADPSATDALDLQAKEYGAITRIFLRNDNCPSMLVWGISDNHSWRDNQPLLYDSSLKPKPAYYNVHAQLRLTAERHAASIKETPQTAPTAPLVSTTYFNLCGQAVATPQGIVLERRVYADGTVSVKKRIY
ncbi:MAG: endo-1,4-beta-xylanase [Bacteroidaceae bacterium]|nr:endo-1,4-beta-xylanase [Bacteroidaceae bacterium]